MAVIQNLTSLIAFQGYMNMIGLKIGEASMTPRVSITQYQRYYTPEKSEVG